jgi:hypothetical protein
MADVVGREHEGALIRGFLSGVPEGSRTLLLVGEAAQLTAMVFDAGNAPIQGRAVAWTSESPSVATVNASGLVTAVGAGSAVIRATVDGVSATTTLTAGLTGTARYLLRAFQAIQADEGLHDC